MPDTSSKATTASKLKADFAAPRVNPFSHLVDKICGVTFVNTPSDPYAKQRSDSVRIGLVSMPKLPFDVVPQHCVDESHIPDGVDRTAFLRQLVEFKGDAPSRMLQAFSEALDTAIRDLKVNVVCFNELALPSEAMMPMLHAKELAWEKSQEHEVLIIAGSGHDARTLHNTGYVFRPGGPRAGQGFHKTVSARSVGELVSSPASRRVAAVDFAGLRIAMMICLDVADYASIASVVKVGDGVDVLLVPCYTPKLEDMGAIAKITSEALPGVVALVNVDLPEALAKCCQVARFGDLEAPAMTRRLNSGAQISVVEINLAEFREKRIFMKTPEVDREEVEFLFGRRDMPVVR